MKSNVLKKTLAAVMSLIIVGGAAPGTVGSGILPVKPALTAQASEPGWVSVEDGVLTFGGEITREQIWEYRDDLSITGIVAAEGTVLPADCTGLFSGYENGTDHWINLEYIDLSAADTSAVEKMREMFRYLGYVSSIDLSGFDTSNVWDMTSMFQGSSMRVLDLSSFDTSSLESIYGMFLDCGNLGLIMVGDKWDVSGITPVSIFGGCKSLVGGAGTAHGTGNTSSVNSSKLARIDGGADAPGYLTEKANVYLDEVIGKLHISGNVTKEKIQAYAQDERVVQVQADIGTVLPQNCSELFQGFGAQTFDLKNADASNVTTMYGMFSGCKNATLFDLSGLDTGNVTNMSYLFEHCESASRIYLNGWDTRKVTNMNYMFLSCLELRTLDVSGFDTSNVTSMSLTFCHCESLTNLNLSGWDTSSVTNMNGMFAHSVSLKSIDLSSFDTSSVTDMNGMFRQCTAIQTLDLSGFDTSSVTDMTGMFRACSAIQALDLSGFDTSSVTDMGYMFESCSAIQALDLSGFDTSSVKKMAYMFEKCLSLKYLNLSGFDTSSVTDMCYMFFRCQSLTSLDLSSFDTSSVSVMNCMFNWCSSLENLDISGFDTSNVVNMWAMFCGCANLTSIDLSNFDTKNVTDMSSMFSECSSLKDLDLSQFDTSSVTDMYGMFEYCKALTSLDLSSFDTSNVKIMKNMFNECLSLEHLDLSSFSTAADDLEYEDMFKKCKSLKTILVSENWTMGEREMPDSSGGGMFRNCTSLVGGNGTTYSAEHTSASYAHADREGDPGYFTLNTLYSVPFKHNCSFQNDLSMYYAVPKESLSGYSNIRLEVTKEEYTAGASEPTLVKKTLTNYKEQTIGGVVYYMFTFDGITSTDMGSILSAVLRADKNGVTYSSKTDKYSIKDYAMDRLRNSNNATFKKMLVDMLNYGAAAQVHFDKNTSNLVNKDLTAAQKAMGTQNLPTLKNAEKSTAVSGATATFDKKNVSFENKTVLMYRLKFAANQNMNNVKLKLTYKTSSGTSVTKTIPASQFTKSGSYYIASMDTIAITDVRSVITAKIYDGSKQISNTFQYSIESYVYNRLNNSDSETFKNLVTEMMKFGISAETHFA